MNLRWRIGILAGVCVLVLFMQQARWHSRSAPVDSEGDIPLSIPLICLFLLSVYFFNPPLSSSSHHQFSLSPLQGEISVGTFNTWNVMFLWEVRQLALAKAIRKSRVHVAVLQEVRAAIDGSWSQIQDLQQHIPEV